MSSTGRGPRMGGPEDFFTTPSWCVRRLLEEWQPPGGLWVEPGAGNGAIIRAVNEMRSDVDWVAIEIREEERANLEATGARVYIDSYIDNADPGDIVAVIGNPPFSLATEFIEQTRALAPLAPVALLLRTNYLGSENRAPFMRSFTPDLKQLPNRPSFFLRLTDSIEYSWFVWPNLTEARGLGQLTVLAPTSIEERQRDMPQIGKCRACGGRGGVMPDGTFAPKKVPGATPCPGCFGFGKVRTGPSEVELGWITPGASISRQMELAP